MWPMALLGPLPGVWHLGDAIYRYVAANRVRRGRCTDDVCAPVASVEPRRSLTHAAHDSRNAFVIG